MAFSERYGAWAVIAGASGGTRGAFARLIASKGVNCVLMARRKVICSARIEGAMAL